MSNERKVAPLPRGVPQDQFEVNPDREEPASQNAVSTAGLSPRHHRRGFQIRWPLRGDRNDADFSSSAGGEGWISESRACINEASFYTL